jgi:hypothetical protein
MTLKVKFTSKGPAAAKEVSKEEKAKQQAQTAVARFEAQYEVLQDMRKDFAQQFPDANQAYQAILQQEDAVRECITSAHAAVQQAKESVGAFACVRKWTTPGYDSEALTELIRKMDNGAELIQVMLEAGVIKEIALAKDATAFFAQNPQYAELVKPAWAEKKEKTAAVTDPKI